MDILLPRVRNAGEYFAWAVTLVEGKEPEYQFLGTIEYSSADPTVAMLVDDMGRLLGRTLNLDGSFPTTAEIRHAAMRCLEGDFDAFLPH